MGTGSYFGVVIDCMTRDDMCDNLRMVSVHIYIYIYIHILYKHFGIHRNSTLS